MMTSSSSRAAWIAFSLLWWRAAIAACLVGSTPLDAEEITGPLSRRFAADAVDGRGSETPNFRRHIVPLLGRLGCNGRNCHGSFQGRGGFRLSMFGFDFAADHAALTSGDAPRVDTKEPVKSLILLKPTNEDEHGGGKRFDAEGWESRVLRSWIAAGAVNDSDKAGELVSLDVTPREVVFRDVGDSAPVKVVAVWSNGTREDVTCLTRFNSNNDAVAEVTAVGVVKSTGRGDTHVIASYDGAVRSIPVLLPVTDRTGDRYPPVATPTKVDELIVARLRKLGIVPSDVCTDAEFLRRVSLDIAGTLPTPDAITAFLADASPDKRARKIDELLETPAYALWWSTKLCDMTGLNAPLYLGNTEFGPLVGEQWRSWLERKVRDNLPYDRIVEGMVVVVSRPVGQKYVDYARDMSAYVRTNEPVDFTARETMPHFWFRGNLATADDKALAFSWSFLGVRLDCAQCHKHPFDRWSQEDFRRFSALFEPIRGGISPECKADWEQMKADLGVPKMKDAAERRQSYWRWAREGKAVPWPEVFVMPPGAGAAASSGKGDKTPKLLGGAEVRLEGGVDPRRPLMDWLRAKDNPYFARAFVNRVWAHYFGRGLVDPPDDLNLANPPSNGELLDWLASAFVDRQYDMKWLHREITRSDAYQRSRRTNDSNRDDERQFSRARLRRLPAEVAVDAMLFSTADSRRVTTWLTDMKDRRIGVQATADHVRTEFSLAVFGKPLRTINCDCEREQLPSLAQAIFVRNDQDLLKMLDRPDGWLAEVRKTTWAEAANRRDEMVRQAYLRTVSREPTPGELERCRRHLTTAADPNDALHDLLWALLNTQEFITNH